MTAITDRFIETASDVFTEKGSAWLEGAIRLLPNLAVALLVLTIFWLGARLVRYIIGRLMSRVPDAAGAGSIFSTLAYILTLTIGMFVALGIVGLEKTVTSLLAGVGVVGLALGFAFQDLATNFVSGLMMSFRRPFRPGDVVHTNGYEGTIVSLHLRTTVVRTFSGQIVQIPNRMIFGDAITNFTTEQRRRVELEIGVSYSDDLEKVKEVAIEAIEALEDRDESEDVRVYFKSFGDSSIVFDLHFWIPYPSVNFLAARDKAVIAIKKAFDQNEISIPFPIRTLQLPDEVAASLNSRGESTAA